MVDLEMVKREPNDRVIATLRDLLERAEQGRIRGIAVATVNQGDTTATVIELGDGYLAPLAGSVSFLQRRLLDMFEGR